MHFAVSRRQHDLVPFRLARRHPRIVRLRGRVHLRKPRVLCREVGRLGDFGVLVMQGRIVGYRKILFRHIQIQRRIFGDIRIHFGRVHGGARAFQRGVRLRGAHAGTQGQRQANSSQ